MNKIAFYGLLILISFCCCEQDTITPPQEKAYEIGKNHFTTVVDGDTREYNVHVPAGYKSNQPTPVVFMLHGTSGDGDNCYNISGWKEVGETENILTVFPTSWHYYVIDEGKTQNTTKWHIFPGSFEYYPGEVPRDDVKFLRQVISELENRFNVDAKRMYLVGFSNGGSMAFRCAIEMSDVFAAIVEAAGSAPRDTTAIPKRDLPVTFQVGNSDDKVLGDLTQNIPMSSFASGINDSPWVQKIVHSHTSTFHFNTQYTISGDTNTVLIATYQGIPPVGNRTFNFVLVKNLNHLYPNGINHWMKGAEQHWAWLKQFTLP